MKLVAITICIVRPAAQERDAVVSEAARVQSLVDVVHRHNTDATIVKLCVSDVFTVDFIV